MSSFPSRQCLEALRVGLAAADLHIESSIQQQLIDYLALLDQWNAVHNPQCGARSASNGAAPSDG